MSRPYYQQTDDLFLAALASVQGLGPKRLSKLFNAFGSWQAAFLAPVAEWKRIKMPTVSLKAWQKLCPLFNPEIFSNYLEHSRTCLVTSGCPQYLPRFNDLEDPPLLLYARGLWPINKTIITVIGSRQPSPYGEMAAERFIPELTRQSVCIASGLAIGLDSMAHQLCLEAGGQTIAILGSGLDCIYPRANTKLAADILNNQGLLLSEYPPSAPPLKANFIRRNRLLAAIADKVLVLEAGTGSGSLQTAKIARELNRPLFAVPGNIFNDQVAGCHQLINEGAKLASEPSHLTGLPPIAEITGKYTNNGTNMDIGSTEAKIMHYLKSSFKIFKGARADEIGTALKLDSASVNSTLSILEIRKLVRQVQGTYYLFKESTEN